MAKVMIGNDAAQILYEILRDEHPITVKDLRVKANRRLHRNMPDAAVSNWAAHHPLGQRAVQQHWLARLPDRTHPRWWADGMPVAMSHEMTEAQLVECHQTADPLFNAPAARSQYLMRDLAGKLPPGSQKKVVALRDNQDEMAARHDHLAEINDLLKSSTRDKDKIIAELMSRLDETQAIRLPDLREQKPKFHQ